MADDVIDRLSLEIESDANNTEIALSRLSKSLMNLKSNVKGLGGIRADGLKSITKSITSISDSMKGIGDIEKGISQIKKLSEIEIGNISQIAEGVKTISSSLNELNSIKLDISGITEPLKNVEKIEVDTTKLRKISNDIKKLSSIDAGAIPAVSDGVKKVADSIKILNNANTKDNGINNTVNALRRMLSIDSKSFKPGNFTKVINSIGSLAKIPDVSSSTNRLVSSLSRIAKAGSSGKEASADIAQLGQTLKKTVKSFVNIGNVSESVNSFIQSVAKLAMVGSKAGQSAAGLGDLSKALRSLFDEMKDVPRIQENTIRMTEALAQLSKTGAHIDKSTGTASASFDKLSKAANPASGIITTAMKKIAAAIKKGFGGVSKLASKTASGIVTATKKIAASFTNISRSTSGLSNASFSLGNLLKTALGFKAVSGLVEFGKSAIELGSEITEVENVVDTAFGSMAQKAYDFASTASEQFGLSELAAKQYSGTMMAMLKSSGVAQEAAADMSITLTGLAGDLASFYNLDTDEAFRKLRAAIAGETEPMKALGVNMNIVNLEAFAMSQGITKAYKDMTLAEQSILRYNYILAKTSDAQGDFARTAGSWANQIRLLKLNLQSISAIIGQGLIAAILPAIKWINKLMAKLTQAAKVFRDFMYVLTGKKIETTPKGIVDDTAVMVDYTTDLSGIKDDSEDAEEGIDDVADSMDEATDSAKKLKKALSVLPFDQLNQLTGNLDDLDSSSKKDKKDKDKDLDVLGLGDMSDLFDDAFDKQEIQPVNEWARRLREAFLAGDWEELGKTIAEMLNKGLQKVYKVIKDITPKVEKALRNFAKVFNSFVKWFDWDLLGRTIGAGVNLVTKAFNALFGPGGIDLEQLGRKLSVGFRGLVDEVNWRELGNAIGNGFMIAWRIASGFVEDMWRLDPDTLLTGWAETGIALAEAVQGIFERINFAQIGKTLSDGFNGIVEVIRNFRNEMASNQTWSMIGKNISDGLNNIIDNIDLSGMAHQISGLLLDLLRMLNDAAEMTHWSDFGYKIAEALFSIPWLDLFNQVFDFVAATFGEATLGFINYLTTNAEQLGIGFATWINSLFDRVKYLVDNIPWEDISSGFTTWINSAIENIDWEGNGQKLNGFVTKLLDVFRYVAENTDWEGLGRGIGEFIGSIDWATHLGTAFGIIWDVLSGLIAGLFDTDAGKITLAIGGGILGIKGLFNAADFALTVAQWVTGGTDKFTLLAQGAQMLFSNLGSVTGLIGGLFSPTGLMVAGIVAGAAWIITHWDEVKGTFMYLWENVLVPLGDFVSTVFTSVWNDVLSPALQYLSETVLPVLSDTLSNLWKHVIDPLARFIADVLKPIIKKLTETFEVLWKNVLKPLAQFLGTVFMAAFEIITTVLNKVVIPVVGAVIKVFQFLWNNVLSPVVTFVSNTLFPVFSSVFESIGNIIENIRTIFQGLIDFVAGVFTGDWRRAWEGVKTIFSGIWDGFANIVKAPINAVIGFLNGLIGGVESAVNSIAKMLNGLKIKAPSWVTKLTGITSIGFNLPTWTAGRIPYLARGGLITSPTLAFTGENYRKEAVLPLENKRTMGMIAESIMAEAPLNSSLKEDVKQAVMEGIVNVAMNHSMGNSDSQAPIYITVQLENDEAIARAAIRGQKQIDYRMNPTPQFG